MANIEKYDKIICVDASALQCELLDKRIPKDKCTIVHSLVTSDPNAQFYRCIGDSGISSANMEWINGKGRFSPGKTDWWPGLQWTPENPPKTSMDQLISIHGTPSFIKIDVEGHEKEVIKSLSAYSGPLAFEWAEELKYETIEIINYIHEVLGHSLFYIQQMDEYTFVPNQNEYISTEEILKLINETWNIERHRLWGMIWCR